MRTLIRADYNVAINNDWIVVEPIELPQMGGLGKEWEDAELFVCLLLLLHQQTQHRLSCGCADKSNYAFICDGHETIPFNRPVKQKND